MVNVSASVELESGLECDAVFGCRCLGIGLLGGIQTCDIGLVVLFVVEGHNLSRDVGFEGLAYRVINSQN